MEYERARAKLAALMAKREITFSAVPVLGRPDGVQWTDSYRQTHYAITIAGSGAAYSGHYSKGCHDVLEALRKGYRNSRGNMVPLIGPGWPDWPDGHTLQRVLSGKAKPFAGDESKFSEVMFRIAGKLLPDAIDVFGCLLMDASGADQPFSDWAAELGYSDDSISAKAAWETCNDIRRALQRMLGGDMETAMNLASEM